MLWEAPSVAGIVWVVSACLLAATASADDKPHTAVFEQQGLRIEVAVTSHVYEWTLTNESDRPVTAVTIEHHNMYNHLAPDGWQIEVSDGRFRAWTDELRYAIRRGESALFKARVSSAGAVLGARTVTVVLDGRESPVRLTGVWAPVAEPVFKIALIPVVLIALALLHTWLVVRGDRRSAVAA
jgi:hypothetical protein